MDADYRVTINYRPIMQVVDDPQWWDDVIGSAARWSPETGWRPL